MDDGQMNAAHLQVTKGEGSRLLYNLGCFVTEVLK